jgi:hypothetical protein
MDAFHWLVGDGKIVKRYVAPLPLTIGSGHGGPVRVGTGSVATLDDGIFTNNAVEAGSLVLGGVAAGDVVSFDVAPQGSRFQGAELDHRELSPDSKLSAKI